MSSLKTFDYPGNFINGVFVSPEQADGEIVTLSPADQSDVVGRHKISVNAVDEAVKAAADAFPAWRALARSEREALLRRYQDVLRKYEDELATTISREVGKPLWDARGEAKALPAKVDLMLGRGAEPTRDYELESVSGRVNFRPYGVMAVVGPFNFPVHLPNGQIVPALLHGNTVVFKPSDKTPNAAVIMARCFEEAGFPKGVFNLVQGEVDGAKALVAHDQVDGILFTGSAAVGKAILRTNAENPGKMIALELGGKNASIVLDDADLEHTRRQIAFAAFASGGQRCTATSRVFATPGIIDALSEALADAARQIKVGHPLSDGVFMGPMVAKDARDAFLSALADAKAGGYEALVESEPLSPQGKEGWYVSPSVYRAKSSDVDIVGYTRDELFGPNVAIYPVKDLDEAIELTNSTRYGLAAGVFTADKSKFEYAAERLRIGVLNWNRSSAGASGSLPFGGVGDSGNNRPAGISAGQFCAWPQSTLFASTDAPLPSWPGLF